MKNLTIGQKNASQPAQYISLGPDTCVTELGTGNAHGINRICGDLAASLSWVCVPINNPFDHLALLLGTDRYRGDGIGQLQYEADYVLFAFLDRVVDQSRMFVCCL